MSKESMKPSRRAWGAPAALVAAFIALALVNAVVLWVTLPPAGEGKIGVRLQHHAYDAGHMVALGVATSAIAWAWSRRTMGRWWSLGALWAAAFGVALVVLREDLANFVQQRQVISPAVTYAGLCLIAGLSIPASWELSRLLARPLFRFLPVALGLALGVGNHLILAFSYPGVHLFVAAIAAFAIAGGLSTLRRRRLTWSRGRVLAGYGVLAACAALSIAIPPSRTVSRELLRSPGTVLAPHLMPLFMRSEGEHRPLLVEGSPWFHDRSQLNAVSPTGPPLLPDELVVVFLTIDALRPDVVPEHEDRFPALARVRREGVDFIDARSPSPSTITTLASIFTGKYYSALYWSEIDDKPFGGAFKGALMPHADSSPRLAGLLDQAGVDTLHVVPLWGNARELGVGTGFREELLTKRDYGRAGEAMRLLLGRLEKQDASSLFAYCHFIDSHAPYNLAGKQGPPHERYLREIELVDRELGRLLQFLDDSEIGKRTLLIVSADHGEAFGEHNTRYHAVTIYEEMVRVPLYIRGPGVKPRTVDTPVTLMDLGPTILDLYGLPTPAHFMGESLAPFLRGEDPKLDRPIALEAGRRMQGLYFADGKKAIIDIRRNTEEVYDLASDPKELDNIIDAQPEVGASHLGALRAFFGAHEYRREGYETPWRPF